MKILIAIFTLLFCAVQVSGQSQKKTHLFADKQKDLSLFINPTFQISQIVQQYCGIPGIRAGVIIDKKFIIGGVFNFNMNEITLPESKGAGKLGMKWGGLHFEYTLWPLQIVHLTIPISAGIGQMKITESTKEAAIGKPNFYFAEPGLMVEINVWKYAKLGIGGSYRYTGDVSYNSLTTKDLNGFSAVASVKFGMFDYPELKKNIRDPLEPKIKINSHRVKKVNSPRVKKRKSLR